MYEQKVREAISDLTHRDIGPNQTVFGGHPLHARIDREAGTGDDSANIVALWCQFLRIIDLQTNSSIVFRILTREGLDDVFWNRLENPDLTPVVVFDNRPNIHREVASGSVDDAFLLQAYMQLAHYEIDAILTPVREGSLGVTEEVAGITPFTTEAQRYPRDEEVWDVAEEVEIATAIFSEMNGGQGELLIAMEEVATRYRAFALPFIELLSGKLQDLHQEQAALPQFDPSTVDFAFFNPLSEDFEVNLGMYEQQVEQIIAYLYPTDQGMLYIRLMKVWDATQDRFNVVRVIQTQPDLSHVDGLRIDSNCTDGVHNLDCHCDCCEQLWLTLEIGLRERRNILVIQEQDHEGKAHGTVLKGLTLRITREINMALTGSETPKGTAFGSDLLYTALDRPHDLRTFNGSAAVLRALDVTKVQTLFMGNSQKVIAVQSAGVTFNHIQSVDVPTTHLTTEARSTLREKHQGMVLGIDGEVVTYLD